MAGERDHHQRKAEQQRGAIAERGKRRPRQQARGRGAGDDGQRQGRERHAERGRKERRLDQVDGQDGAADRQHPAQHLDAGIENVLLPGLQQSEAEAQRGEGQHIGGHRDHEAAGQVGLHQRQQRGHRQRQRAGAARQDQGAPEPPRGGAPDTALAGEDEDAQPAAERHVEDFAGGHDEGEKPVVVDRQQPRQHQQQQECRKPRHEGGAKVKDDVHPAHGWPIVDGLRGSGAGRASHRSTRMSKARASRVVARKQIRRVDRITPKAGE